MPADQFPVLQEEFAGTMPVVDGRFIPADPIDPRELLAISRNIPTIVGTNKDEMIFFSTPDLFTLDDQGMHTRLRTTLGDKTNHVVDVYRRNRPQASPTDLYFAITTGHVFWRKAIAMAERKGAFKAAPVYMFLFSYESEVPVSATARLARLLTPTRINLP